MEKKNKKVVIVLPKLTAGGTERTAAVLSNYMVSKNIDVTIVLMFKRERFYELNDSVKLIEPSNYRERYGKIGSIPFLLFFLRKKIKNENPDSIFCLGYILIGLFVSLGLKSKVFISGRSSPDRVRFPNNKMANSLYHFLYMLLRSRVDGIIAQTHYAKEVYQKKYKCPIKVIPNFLREIKPYDLERKNQIISMGRCVFEKGQHFLIEAFAKLKAPKWKLLILGDGPLKSELEELAKKLNVSKQIEFLGFQKDVDYFLSQSKIFAFTSIIEGYPNALIEGMANGLAPVSFNCVAGPSDIINDGENGFLIDIEDVELFSNKLQLLLDNPLILKKISKHALKINETNKLNLVAGLYVEFLLK